MAANTPILGTSDTADGIATTKSQANYNCGGMDAINYSAPGAQAYVDSVVDQLASWGVDYIKLDGISNSNAADVQAWQAAIQQSGRPMVLNITQGSYTIKLAPTLQEYANQWEFAPDIELNGPDEGSADACNNPPYTGCLSVFPLTSYATGRPTGSEASPGGSRTAARAASTTTTRSRSATAAPTRACPWPPRSRSSACGRSARPR